MIDCLTFLRNSSATIRALALREIFISLISLSISSMNCSGISSSRVWSHKGGVVTDLYDKVNELVFVHLLCVEVGDQETDVVTLATN